MTSTQTFKTTGTDDWLTVDFLPGVELMLLAEPVKDGSVHLARLVQGTVIPAHTHPAAEYVFVLSGTIETGGTRCEAGTFWQTPADTRQGPHIAVSDVTILTTRLGPMGAFE